MVVQCHCTERVQKPWLSQRPLEIKLNCLSNISVMNAISPKRRTEDSFTLSLESLSMCLVLQTMRTLG